MEENSSCRKRVKSFIAASVIVNTLVNSVLDMLTKNLEAEVPTFSSELMLRLPGIAATVIILTAMYLTGKGLTGEKRKAIILMSSVFLAQSATDALAEIFSCTAEVMTTLKYITPQVFSVIATAVSLIEIPFVIIAAYYIFTAFEGVNPRFNGQCLIDSQMPLSRARTRFFAYQLIGGFVLGTAASLPPILIGLLTLQEFYDVETLMIISSQVATVFLGIAGLLLNYVAGYRAYKSRTDAMAFVACSALSARISNIFINLLLIPQSLSLSNSIESATQGSMDYTGAMTSVGTTGIFGILTMAVSIVVPLVMLQYFFSQAKITLFNEEQCGECNPSLG